MAEDFDTLQLAGPTSYHDFDIGGNTEWHQVNFPSFARRFVIQCAVPVEIATITINGEGPEAGPDRRWPVVANVPWSQPLSRGKGQGLTFIRVRDPAGGTPTVFLTAEAFEGG